MMSERMGEMQLSDIGTQARHCWTNIPEHFPFVKLDAFVVMPNHIHGIIVIDKSDSKIELNRIIETLEPIVETQNFASLLALPKNKFGPQSNNLASIIRGYKIGVTLYCKKNKNLFGWQPRFYDHIIRNDDELNRIRTYITNNPMNWTDDEHYVM